MILTPQVISYRSIPLCSRCQEIRRRRRLSPLLCLLAGGVMLVLVRDTKQHGGPMLALGPAAWRKFADRLKRS
jgi:hypothetical protein